MLQLLERLRPGPVDVERVAVRKAGHDLADVAVEIAGQFGEIAGGKEAGDDDEAVSVEAGISELSMAVMYRSDVGESRARTIEQSYRTSRRNAS